MLGKENTYKKLCLQGNHRNGALLKYFFFQVEYVIIKNVLFPLRFIGNQDIVEILVQFDKYGYINN